MYSVGSAGACFSAVVHTGTSVLTQDVVSCFEGFDPRVFMRLTF